MKSKYIGRTYGEVTIISEDVNNPLRCVGMCVCGKEKTFLLNNLRRGRTRSCGCLRAKYIRDNAKCNGDSVGNKLYYVWVNMKTRCYNSNFSGFAHYGGKGVKVCEDWKDNYMTFKEWSLTNGYRDRLSLDRINVNGDYCPENCRWADIITQARNKTTTWYVEINGVTKTAKEWCEIHGVNYKTAHTRKSRGWSNIDAVSTI